MINYLFELACAHMILLLGYGLLIKSEKEYTVMRLYLISATLFALIIPFLKLPKLFQSISEIEAVVTQPTFIIDTTTYTTTVEATTSGFHILFWIYGIVSLFFCTKFLIGIHYLVKLKWRNRHYKKDACVVISTSEIEGSFSFFNWIFINNENETGDGKERIMLKHEMAHVELKHTYDLIFLEIFKIFFWWLPSAWLINIEMRKLHEYQADARVLQSENLNDYSSILILSTLNSNGLTMVSPFNNGLTFKRIKAMRQQKRNIHFWKFGTILSVVAMLLITLACSEEKAYLDQSKSDQLSEREVFTIVEEQPSFEGGFDAFYKYVMGELKYPLEARKSGVEGRVFAQFIVERDGSISNVQTVRGIDTECNNEVVRVLKSAPPFQPGSQRGRTVRVKMVLPVIFELNKEETNPDNTAKGSIIVGQLDMKNGLLDVKAKYHNGKWSGKILSPEGDVLPGVNIVLEGTEYGTVSDLDGTFSIDAKKSQSLHVSFVGYESVRLTNQK